MAHRIPHQIIEEILHHSLSGWSTREIAQSVKISVGSVQSIIQELAVKDKDHRLLRTLAVNLHKSGLDVLDYAWLVRLGNVLLNSGVKKEKIEDIINDLPVYCYKAGIDLEILVDLLKRFKEYLEANPGDPHRTNLVVENYQASTEYYRKCIQEKDNVTIDCDADKEKALKKLLESMVTETQVQALNDGAQVKYTKEEMIAQIVEVIKNPSEYCELFFETIQSFESSVNS